MKNVALLCYCLPEGMFNDDYSIIFSHLEVDERNECNAKSHFKSDFSFWCKVGMRFTLYWLLGSSVQKQALQTENDLHSLLANTGGSVYYQMSSTADSCSNNAIFR